MWWCNSGIYNSHIVIIRQWSLLASLSCCTKPGNTYLQGLPVGWDHYTASLFKPPVLTWAWFCPLGTIWQCPGTFLFFTTGTGYSWLLVGRGQDCYNHPTICRTAHKTNNYLVQSVSRVKMRDLGINRCWPSMLIWYRECERQARATGGWADQYPP